MWTRVGSWWWILWLVVVGSAQAAPPRILKVLPHLLDQQGRHALAPSLYERDAYQHYLQLHTNEVSGLRFDVQWKATVKDPTRLKLRLELRASRVDPLVPHVLEQPAKSRGWFSRWSRFTLEGEAYRQLGQVIAWRVSLWEGDQMLAEQTSFLW